MNGRGLRGLLFGVIAVALSGCSGGGSGPGGVDATTDAHCDIQVDVDSGGEQDACVTATPLEVSCLEGGCPAIAVEGDPYAHTPPFWGYSDPALEVDPEDQGHIWLAYSWLRVETVTGTQGATQVAVVSTHLAQSDDGGQTFVFEKELWPALRMQDPEGSGESGLLASEAPSLAWLRDRDGHVTWYGAHLRYFLRPVRGYHPKWWTSWTIRVGAAATPEELASAEEAVLGVTGTASVYQADVALDQLVGLSPSACSMVNNPSLFARDETLYLVFECLAKDMDPDRTTIHVVATEPLGTPGTWVWRYVGLLTSVETYRELGVEMLQQPEVAMDSEGRLVLVITPSRDNPDPRAVTRIHEGVVALELQSLEPPVLARDCDGGLLVRALSDTEGMGGCTYRWNSATGILCHTVETWTDPRYLYATGLRP